MIRSLMIGDCDHYVSPYMLGVKQAMGLLGHRHFEVSIRRPLVEIARRIVEVKPDVIWTHMLLWAPRGSPPREQLVDIVTQAAKAGARVVLHDGDYKEQCRHTAPISDWCSVALVNHGFDRSAWRVPILHWPYFAMAQDRIAEAVARWKCPLFFAGSMGSGDVYAKRSALLDSLRQRVDIRTPTPAEGNTLQCTAEIAASADAVLGFGRPEVRAWIDTRVFQYPGAGAILLHDDTVGILEPWVHFVPYRSGDPGSVVDALARLKSLPETERRAMRERAFAFVQERHNSIARVRQVLGFLELDHG